MVPNHFFILMNINFNKKLGNMFITLYRQLNFLPRCRLSCKLGCSGPDRPDRPGSLLDRTAGLPAGRGNPTGDPAAALSCRRCSTKAPGRRRNTLMTSPHCCGIVT